MNPNDIITINTTFKVEAKELSSFEWELRQVVNVIDFKHVSNTEKQCELYINKHNKK